MIYALTAENCTPSARLAISGSKSETNRLLILQQFYSGLHIKNPSDSDDTHRLKKALESKATEIDIGSAGTAMRFLTAYYAVRPGRRILTGNERMQNRPIAPLVNALKELGADIRYLKRRGYPPLEIKGTQTGHHSVRVRADISSQFVSALLLIAPRLPNGLTLDLQGTVTSKPYIKMTVQLLRQIGVEVSEEAQCIIVRPCKTIKPITVEIEPDWSSASYFYSMAALSSQAKIRLIGYNRRSLQGDAIVHRLYENFGVKTAFENHGILITKPATVDLPRRFDADFKAHPDLAQTVAVTCLGLQIPCCLTGLQSLRLKETDRLSALKNELEKFGAPVKIDDGTLDCQPPPQLNKSILVKSYDDHRMAMAFTPLAFKTPVKIEHVSVVSKSFPGFWKAVRQCGMQPTPCSSK